MSSKNQIKLIRSLHEKKYREQNGLFIVEGEKSVAEVLESDFKVDSIYATMDVQRTSKRSFNYEIITEAEMSKISALKTPQNILAIVKLPKKTSVNTIDVNKLILVL